MMLQNVAGAAVSVLIAQAAGAIGTIFSSQSIPTWYAGLEKPLFNPPNWIFGPVWITLYTFMGIAAYLVWKKRHEAGARQTLYLYGAQLILNALWSIIFFGARNLGFAFGEILLMLVFIIVTTVLFFRHSKWAGGLMIPYIAWVSFATVLNGTIWYLNM